jgi:hypothetical protein
MDLMSRCDPIPRLKSTTKIITIPSIHFQKFFMVNLLFFPYIIPYYCKEMIKIRIVLY